MSDQPVKTIEIWADTRRRARCRSCERDITFAEIVKGGKWMPFDGAPVALRTRHDPATRRLIEEVDLTESHFATCPEGKEWSRRNRKG